MQNTEIKIVKVTEKKFEAVFELINDVGVRAVLSFSGETEQDAKTKADKFLAGKLY